MSKGISTRQRQILGLAVAISRLRNGEPVARTPQPHPHFRVPVVTGVWPDISTYVAAHIVGGVGLRRDGRWKSLLETTPVALAARSSISRAISSLLKRGLLAYRPYYQGDYVKFGRTHGYILTAAGLALGLSHEPTVPDLALRLWLMDDNYRKAWFHPPIPITQAYRQIGMRFAQRYERALLDPAAPVSGLGVTHHLARVADRLQVAGNNFVERCSLRAGDLDDAASRRRERHLGDDRSNVVRRNGLEQAGRKPDPVSIRT
jgi:hypothetical protein